MKKQNIRHLATTLTILSCISIIPQKAMAQTFSSFMKIQNNALSFHLYGNYKGTGIFDEENLKYLSSEQQKQLEEYRKYKDTGKKLSEEQEKNLHSIVDCVIKGKLGDEKYKDFKLLMKKKGDATTLTKDEKKRLKEYRKILHNCDDCSNNEILKQFLR